MERLTQFDTKEPNAVEIHVCDKMWGAVKDARMDETSAKLLVGVLSNDEESEEVTHLLKEILEKSLPLNLFVKRLENMDIDLDNRTKIMMGTILDRPGTAILYACYFMKYCKVNGRNAIDINTWCTDMFPFGLFSEETLQEVWDGQKVLRSNDGEFTPDNLVDYPTAFLSLKAGYEAE